MEDLLDDLGKREKEIYEYFKLLKFVDGGVLSNQEGDSFEVNPLLVKTLKGAVFLLLYNLIESTMREAISAIHDSISSSSHGYDDIRIELQKELWRRARLNSIDLDDIVSNTSGGVSLGFHSATFSSKNLFSGNITRAEIKKMATIYGFKERTDARKTAKGERLEEVKNNRNDLAHGNKTFSQVGAVNTISELETLASTTIHYIYEIVDNIMEYVENKQYQYVI
jgi:hypothetical protein